MNDKYHTFFLFVLLVRYDSLDENDRVLLGGTDVNTGKKAMEIKTFNFEPVFNW